MSVMPEAHHAESTTPSRERGWGALDARDCSVQLVVNSTAKLAWDIPGSNCILSHSPQQEKLAVGAWKVPEQLPPSLGSLPAPPLDQESRTHQTCSAAMRDPLLHHCLALGTLGLSAESLQRAMPHV